MIDPKDAMETITGLSLLLMQQLIKNNEVQYDVQHKDNAVIVTLTWQDR